MKISVFPSIKPRPANKDEKRIEAKKSGTVPEVREFHDDETLLQLITSFAWSPALYSGARKNENFVSTDLLVFDVDDSMTIEECRQIVEAAGLACLCLPSTSHTDEQHRFRVIFPLAHTIYDEETFQLTWNKGAELLQVVDVQCSDLCRFFFSCRDDDGFWNPGELFVPVKPAPKPVKQQAKFSLTKLVQVSEDLREFYLQLYGEHRTRIPEVVDYFVKNAHTGLQGSWVNTLNSFCFSLSLSNVDESAIMSVCEQLAPEPLDQNDLYQINKAIKDGQREREKEAEV